MATDILFIFGFSFLFVHEMDAIRCKEWRMFPGLSRLKDKQAEVVFVAVHVPLIAIILALLSNGNTTQITEAVLSGLMVAHMIAHLFSIKHSNNEFKELLSWLYISGSAACGIAYLAMFFHT